MIVEKFKFIKDKILIVSDFLDENTCTLLIQQIKKSKIEKGKIVSKDVSLVDEKFRRVSTAILGNNSTDIVSQRIHEIMPFLQDTFNINLSKFQPLSFLHYKKGDFFKMHSDTSKHEDSIEEVKNRMLSVVIFLNSETKRIKPNTFCGGSLNFYELDENIDFDNYKYEVHGEMGTAIIFKSDILHEVSQITNGERFTIVTWGMS